MLQAVQTNFAIEEKCRAFCGTVENSPVVQPRVDVCSIAQSGF